jgi:protein SCO1
MMKMKEDKEFEMRKIQRQAIGKMAIGGDFELVDNTGKLVKNSDFFGKWLLIYFGSLSR